MMHWLDLISKVGVSYADIIRMYLKDEISKPELSVFIGGYADLVETYKQQR